MTHQRNTNEGRIERKSWERWAVGGRLESRAFNTETRLAMHLLFKANKNLWDRKIAKVVFLWNGFQLSVSPQVQGPPLRSLAKLRQGTPSGSAEFPETVPSNQEGPCGRQRGTLDVSLKLSSQFIWPATSKQSIPLPRRLRMSAHSARHSAKPRFPY